MEFRELFLCLAVSLLTCTLLFFYFKNRMFKTEQKVDLMFQLIQEHERSAQLRHRQRPFVARQGLMPRTSCSERLGCKVPTQSYPDFG